MTREEFFAMPEIRAQFPLTFEGKGRARFTHFSVACNDCKAEVPQPRTRGYAVPTRKGATYRDPGTPAYEVVAQALCPACDKLTTAEYVLGVTAGGQLFAIGRHPKTGEERQWRSRKRSWWERLKQCLRAWATRRHSGDGT